MSPQEDPMVTHYMARFESALRRYGVPEAQEIALDVRSHIAEALGYGRPLDSVMSTLGQPDALARAYAVELLMHPPKDARVDAVMRFLRILALVIAGSFVSLIVATVLGAFGLSFLLAAIILLMGGVLEAFGVQLAHVHTGGLPPWAVIALSPVAGVVAWFFFWLLWLYVRAAARAVRRALPSSGIAKPAA
ncbi:MAG TPA: hypothetical protein VG943_00560 [Caulobacterales bacterium]|nr:hypothetical protein [Caulobacterales bacterium]